MKYFIEYNTISKGGAAADPTIDDIQQTGVPVIIQSKRRFNLGYLKNSRYPSYFPIILQKRGIIEDIYGIDNLDKNFDPNLIKLLKEHTDASFNQFGTSREPFSVELKYIPKEYYDGSFFYINEQFDEKNLDREELILLEDRYDAQKCTERLEGMAKLITMMGEVIFKEDLEMNSNRKIDLLKEFFPSDKEQPTIDDFISNLEYIPGVGEDFLKAKESFDSHKIF